MPSIHLYFDACHEHHVQNKKYAKVKITCHTSFVDRKQLSKFRNLPSRSFHSHGQTTGNHVSVEQFIPTSSGGQTEHGLLFGSGPEYAWDGGGVGNPIVRCFMGDDEQRWYMWYNGYSQEAAKDLLPPACIGLATSSDGILWRRGSEDMTGQGSDSQGADVGRVLGPNPDWWWHDTRHLSVSDVQMFSSTTVNTGVGIYWMFYTGGNFEETLAPKGLPDLNEGENVEGLRSRVGLAMSQDGKNWARIEADHHTGALFDAGGESDWDSLLNAAPQVVMLSATEMRMYYHSFDPRKQKWVVGWATSKEGFRWQKKGPIFDGGPSGTFDAGGVAAHYVVRDSDSRRYVMFYEAVAGDGSRSISVATSKDGLTDWKRLGKPVLSPQDGESSWDSAAVGSPCAVSMAEGKWRLYYAGRDREKGPWQGIGLAITDNEHPQMFDGVNVGFKRRSGS